MGFLFFEPRRKSNTGDDLWHGWCLIAQILRKWQGETNWSKRLFYNRMYSPVMFAFVKRMNFRLIGRRNYRRGRAYLWSGLSLIVARMLRSTKRMKKPKFIARSLLMEEKSEPFIKKVDIPSAEKWQQVVEELAKSKTKRWGSRKSLLD